MDEAKEAMAFSMVFAPDSRLEKPFLSSSASRPSAIFSMPDCTSRTPRVICFRPFIICDNSVCTVSSVSLNSSEVKNFCRAISTCAGADVSSRLPRVSSQSSEFRRSSAAVCMFSAASDT